jgi:hypothetical protein
MADVAYNSASATIRDAELALVSCNETLTALRLLVPSALTSSLSRKYKNARAESDVARRKDLISSLYADIKILKDGWKAAAQNLQTLQDAQNAARQNAAHVAPVSCLD